jgi:hypothetical protein
MAKKFVNSGEIQGYYPKPKVQKGTDGAIQGYIPKRSDDNWTRSKKPVTKPVTKTK